MRKGAEARFYLTTASGYRIEVRTGKMEADINVVVPHSRWARKRCVFTLPPREAPIEFSNNK